VSINLFKHLFTCQLSDNPTLFPGSYLCAKPFFTGVAQLMNIKVDSEKIVPKNV